LLENGVSHKVEIECEGIRSGMRLGGIDCGHAVFGLNGIGYASSENLDKRPAFFKQKSALVVAVVLGSSHSLLLGKHFSVNSFYRNWVCCVATSPNNQIGFLHVLQLVRITLALHQLHPFLNSRPHVVVKPPCVASQPREAVQVPFFISEELRFEFCVTVINGCLDGAVEYFNWASVQYFY